MLPQIIGVIGAIIALGTYAALLTGRIQPTGRACGALTVAASLLVGFSALSPINVGVLLMQAAFGAIGLHTLLRKRKLTK